MIRKSKTEDAEAGWVSIGQKKLEEQIEATYGLWCKLSVDYVRAPPFALMAKAAMHVFEATVKEREASYHSE